ncbi:HD domain-containing protein [Streptomyces sp. CA-250714]|uniref:HD domain-containing protein n=1 Tax=Streptomyces sp. CA-250714 TaxID=3240060 RepID=UPI003D8B3D0A
MSTTEPSPEGEAADAAHRALLERWNALLLRAREGAEGPDPAPYGEDLLGRWAEPHRRYHATAHLRTVLDRVDELAAHLSPDGDDAAANTVPGAEPDTGPDAHVRTTPRTVPGGDLDAVRLAAWFHDAVYRPDRSENEERSARLAERALPEAGVPAARVAEVARLVRLTVSHDPAPGDINGELLCDADLAVLAGSPESYAHYAAEIRQEYAFVPDAAFREGRGTVLRQLLGLPHLFRTRYARTHWEPTARHNLTTELQLLEA